MKTAEEFEKEYAKFAGMTVERLRELGRIVVPCDCGGPTCKGWRSINREDYKRDALEKFKQHYPGVWEQIVELFGQWQPMEQE